MTNFILFIFACVALGLSIWAIAKPCKKDGFGDDVKDETYDDIPNFAKPLYSLKTGKKVDKKTLTKTKSVLGMGMSNDCNHKPYSLQCKDYDDTLFSVPNDSVFYITNNSLYENHIYSNDVQATGQTGAMLYYSDLPCSAFKTIS